MVQRKIAINFFLGGGGGCGVDALTDWDCPKTNF